MEFNMDKYTFKCRLYAIDVGSYNYEFVLGITTVANRQRLIHDYLFTCAF